MLKFSAKSEQLSPLGVKGLSNHTLGKYKRDSCVQVKNKLCLECTIIMRLFFWDHSCGNKTRRFDIAAM
jgi:hypothetical protein